MLLKVKPVMMTVGSDSPYTADTTLLFLKRKIFFAFLGELLKMTVSVYAMCYNGIG